MSLLVPELSTTLLRNSTYSSPVWSNSRNPSTSPGALPSIKAARTVASSSPAARAARDTLADVTSFESQLMVNAQRRPDKIRIDRLQSPGRADRVGKDRRSHSRHACAGFGCGKTFGRPSDLDRHRKTIHAQAKEHYHCATAGCEHQNRRIDKMQEHCRKMHGQSTDRAQFITVDDEIAKMFGCVISSYNRVDVA